MDSSQLSQRTISQPMELALNQIIQEIRIFYQPPSGVTAPEEARVWIDRFKRTLAAETTDPAELIAAWEEFRRTFTRGFRSEEQTSELQSLMSTSYAVLC